MALHTTHTKAGTVNGITHNAHQGWYCEWHYTQHTPRLALRMALHTTHTEVGTVIVMMHNTHQGWYCEYDNAAQYKPKLVLCT